MKPGPFPLSLNIKFGTEIKAKTTVGPYFLKEVFILSWPVIKFTRTNKTNLACYRSDEQNNKKTNLNKIKIEGDLKVDKGDMDKMYFKFFWAFLSYRKAQKQNKIEAKWAIFTVLYYCWIVMYEINWNCKPTKKYAKFLFFSAHLNI